MKARKEIADYIKTHRLERARVRVEHIIREDYLVEALEVLELYCDLLLARFGLLEQKAYCDDTLVEAVSTLIWASPRLVADVQEFGIDDDAPPPMDGKPFIPSEEFVQEGNPYTAEATLLQHHTYCHPYPSYGGPFTYTRTPTITTRQSSWLAILNGTTTCSNPSTSNIRTMDLPLFKSYVPRASIWGRWGC
eukprot:Em0200g11a